MASRYSPVMNHSTIVLYAYPRMKKTDLCLLGFPPSFPFASCIVPFSSFPFLYSLPLFTLFFITLVYIFYPQGLVRTLSVSHKLHTAFLTASPHLLCTNHSCYTPYIMHKIEFWTLVIRINQIHPTRQYSHVCGYYRSENST